MTSLKMLAYSLTHSFTHFIRPYVCSLTHSVLRSLRVTALTLPSFFSFFKRMAMASASSSIVSPTKVSIVGLMLTCVVCQICSRFKINKQKKKQKTIRPQTPKPVCCQTEALTCRSFPNLSRPFVNGKKRKIVRRYVIVIQPKKKMLHFPI